MVDAQHNTHLLVRRFNRGKNAESQREMRLSLVFRQRNRGRANHRLANAKWRTSRKAVKRSAAGLHLGNVGRRSWSSCDRRALKLHSELGCSIPERKDESSRQCPPRQRRVH
jgi:hypothetical protein